MMINLLIIFSHFFQQCIWFDVTNHIAGFNRSLVLCLRRNNVSFGMGHAGDKNYNFLLPSLNHYKLNVYLLREWTQVPHTSTVELFFGMIWRCRTSIFSRRYGFVRPSLFYLFMINNSTLVFTCIIFILFITFLEFI